MQYWFGRGGPWSTEATDGFVDVSLSARACSSAGTKDDACSCSCWTIRLQLSVESERKLGRMTAGAVVQMIQHLDFVAAGFLGRWLEMRQVRRSSICPESGMQELYLTDFCIAVIGIGIKRTRQSEIAGTHCSRFWNKMNFFTTILKRKEMLNWTCVEATSCTQAFL